MAGIAGIYHLDGAPADPELLLRMAEAMAYRAPDGMKVWRDGPVGFAHGHFWTTPEDEGEEQPIAAAGGRLWLTADARLDNREELIPLLRGKGHLSNKTPTDAELILAAYACWGEDCPRHLVGDFAFAIWDVEARTLFLARDVIGLRQLYYAQVGGTLYFATAIRALLAVLPQPPALNRRVIEAFLRGAYVPWISQTVYAGLLKLPPAHHLTVHRTQVSIPQLYYVLGSQPPPRCATDGEWLEAYRALLTEGIRARSRSRTPVRILLSGGLDSSSVACVAYELARQRGELSKIGLFSLVYPDTPAADESEFIDAVAQHCQGIASTRFVSDHFWALRDLQDLDGFPLDEPDVYMFRAHVVAMLRAAAAEGGCRVVLWGDGGDQVLCQNLYYEPASLRDVDWRHWLAEIPHFYQRLRQKNRLALKENRDDLLLFLLRAYVKPAVPEPLMARLRRWRGVQNPGLPWLKEVPSGADPDPGVLDKSFFAPDGLTPTANLVHSNVRIAYDIIRHGALDIAAAYAGVEMRSPFWDRRLVDFLLHIPISLPITRTVHGTLSFHR